MHDRTKSLRTWTMSLPVLAVLSTLAGCASMLTEAIVRSPNHGKTFEHEKPLGQRRLNGIGVDRELRVNVGPPDASLRIWIMEPNLPDDAKPKATVLILHGYRGGATWLMGVGKSLRKAGYRSVLVDLRGHGRSSGDFITYGVQESKDLVQVIDHLDEQKLLTPKLAVWGISMGASTAIQLAAREPRINTVIAVAPYADMRSITPHVVRLMVPIYGWLISDESIRRYIDDAAEKAGFNPDDANTVHAIRQVRVPVLILHGDCDLVVPKEHSHKVHQAAPDLTQFIELDWVGHIPAHFSSRVRDISVDWLDRHLVD